MSAARAYYNEIDPYAAQWLRNLIDAGHISPGDVDERSVVDIRPDDLRGYNQCHFFAGIGVWSAALRDAGWPDDQPVWTGSCPCQPFSAAGKRGGFADERHLWPAFFHLIRECRPSIVFGEQVASPDGLRWFDLVSADLEGEAYAIGAADLCAAGICVEAGETETGRAALEWIRGAVQSCPDPGLAAELRDFAKWFGRAGGIGPAHIRQRLCWVAYADGGDACAEGLQRGGEQRQQPQDGRTGGVGVADSAGWTPWQFAAPASRHGNSAIAAGCRSDPARSVGNAAGYVERQSRIADPSREQQKSIGRSGIPNAPVGFVGNADDARPQGRIERRDGADKWAAGPAGLACNWIICTDGKARPVEPGSFPLAHGAPARVGRLRAYGNAMHRAKIVHFVSAASEAMSA